MNFTSEQLEFILIQMGCVIEDSRELVSKYGHGDEVTAGCDDVIESARSVINTILDFK